MLYLNESDVAASGGHDWIAALEDVRRAFQCHAREDSVLPPKVTLPIPYAEKIGPSSGPLPHYVAMPAYLGGNIPYAGFKWVSVGHPYQVDQPDITAVIVIQSPDSGYPAAIMDGTLITAIRTAAVTAVAAQELAPPYAEVLGIIGAGAQGAMHLRLLPQVLPKLKQIRLYNRSRSKAEELASRMKNEVKAEIVVTGQAQEAVVESDILVTATSSSGEPIVHGEWLKEGVLYVQVGRHEIAFEAVRQFDKILVDDWEQIRHRGVQTLALMEQEGEWRCSCLHGTLGQRLLGRIVGRESASERIMFSSIGLGVTDLAIAARIYEQATARGIGQWLAR
ncbi:ornithine cyclodeaminase family protein [Paenibacillus sp. UNC451MF]|uniref:ornithine cyclodeaminase family protein n=1 Tax=Paenibacillus sp. UNC451MF TaxID=1449063 RepID=UPI00068AD6C1|nr:ornithine cyclodeaminase family protein [Paenibacillus sp. UNC451MF]